MGREWLLKSPICFSSTFLLTLVLIQFSLIQFCERCCGSRTGARTPSEHRRRILEQGDRTPTIGPYDKLATHPGVHPAFARMQLGWAPGEKHQSKTDLLWSKRKIFRQLLSVNYSQCPGDTFKNFLKFTFKTLDVDV